MSCSLGYRTVVRRTCSVVNVRLPRALPNLAHIRVESQRMNTDRLLEFYRRVLPKMDPQLLWYWLRVRSEFGWLVDELAMEEGRLPQDVLFRETARIAGRALMDDAGSTCSVR